MVISHQTLDLIKIIIFIFISALNYQIYKDVAVSHEIYGHRLTKYVLLLSAIGLLSSLYSFTTAT